MRPLVVPSRFGFEPPSLGSGGAGLLRSGDTLCRSHGFERPVAPDSAPLRTLLAKVRKDSWRQFLNHYAYLNRVVVRSNDPTTLSKGG
jgi:hypothetical protein